MDGGHESHCVGRVYGADEDDLRSEKCWSDFKCFNVKNFIYVD
jgi:hypothetical protein